MNIGRLSRCPNRGRHSRYLSLGGRDLFPAAPPFQQRQLPAGGTRSRAERDMLGTDGMGQAHQVPALGTYTLPNNDPASIRCCFTLTASCHLH